MSPNDFLGRLAVAVVGIVAVGMAAATVSDTLEVGGSGGFGADSGSGSGYAPPADDPSAGGSFPAFLEYLLAALVVLLALALAWYLLVHRRELVKILAVVLVVSVVVTAIVLALSQLDWGSAMNATPETPATNETPGGSPGDGEGEMLPISLAPVFAVLAVVAAIFAGALVVSRDDERDVTVDTDSDLTDEDVAAVGAAAGQAAERIEGDDASDTLDNEIYRTWRDMTRLLEVDRPETSTPGEFATAAVEAGMDRAHVNELTRLFEDVRYGHAEPTAELESRAIAVLREIEATYADEDDEPTGTRGDEP
ncbi:DUF4129 domain-containing protein [Natribaculum luteum]|uniref:DUF4129 domain-containing protein n=1 Tax=Natribaculum luteum TaxID=1586232 RepID=A0ABD5NW45_9EURY|nr:DUF4129 domain-containing protein [Natribaculum luteum]